LTFVLQETNEKFIAARQNDPIQRQREEVLQRFEIAFSKQQEIALNLSEALQFYQDFAKLLDQLRNTVREVRHFNSMRVACCGIDRLLNNLITVGSSTSDGSAGANQHYRDERSKHARRQINHTNSNTCSVYAIAGTQYPRTSPSSKSARSRNVATGYARQIWLR
jgi:hypothetical protein